MRLPIGLKVGAFAVVVMGGYSWFANSIPQIESKPPQELSLEGGNVTQAQLVKAGEEIYHTKGTCEICHRIGQQGTRAPDLAGVGARAAKRKPGMSAKAYIIESLITPQAYVVSTAVTGSSTTDVAANIGSPQGSMLFFSVYLFKAGFQDFRMGYAAALAWILLLITMLCTLAIIKGSRRWVHYQGGGFK